MAVTAADKNDSIAMPVASASTTRTNAVDPMKPDFAVDGKIKTTNDDKNESASSSTTSSAQSQVRQRTSKRPDISCLISNELTEMEKRIDDVDDTDSDNDSTKHNANGNKSTATIKSTNSPEITLTSTSIDGARHVPDCIDKMHLSNDINVGWDKSESFKPMQRLFAQSHANETPKRRRCDDCVQIPIERIDLSEDDDGMIFGHDVSSVQSSASCYSLSVLIAIGIGSCLSKTNCVRIRLINKNNIDNFVSIYSIV